MGLDFPPEPRRPRQPKQPRGSSGKGSGTTVGMAVAIFGTAFLTFLAAVGGLIYAHLSS